MKNRSQVFTHFCSLHAEIKTQFKVSIQTLRSDNAKEYLSQTFQSYTLQNGILHESSCVDTPVQNGVAERKNRNLLEVARALLFYMIVPKLFWYFGLMRLLLLVSSSTECHLLFWMEEVLCLFYFLQSYCFLST